MLLDIKNYIEELNPLAGWHKGTVISNNDPKNLGRVKVIINNLFVDDADKLPWVHQKSPAFLGGSAAGSFFAVPEIGSELIIEFPEDDVYMPIYTGHWQNSETHASFLNQNYPDSYGWSDSSGFKFHVDKKARTFEIVHPSGASISIDADGKISNNSKGSAEIASEDGRNKIIVDSEQGLVEIQVENHSLKSTKSVIENEETIERHGIRNTLVQGSDDLRVVGNAKDSVGGSKNEIIGVNKSQVIAQDKSVLVGGKSNETYGLGRIINIATGGETKTVTVGNISYSTPAGVMLFGTDVQPIMRGADNADWTVQHTHPAGTGPTGPPNESAQVINLLSKKVFIE